MEHQHQKSSDKVDSVENWQACQGFVEVSNLKGWQKAQNGALDKIESHLFKLYILMLGSMASIVAGLLVLILKQ